MSKIDIQAFINKKLTEKAELKTDKDLSTSLSGRQFSEFDDKFKRNSMSQSHEWLTSAPLPTHGNQKTKLQLGKSLGNFDQFATNEKLTGIYAIYYYSFI